MTIQKMLAGLITAGLMLTTAACNYSSGPMKTTAGKSIGGYLPAAVDDHSRQDQTKTEENGDQEEGADAAPKTDPETKTDETPKTDPAPPTIADLSGTWKARKYVVSKNGQEADFIEKGLYEDLELLIAEDGSASATVTVKGKTSSVSFKLVLEDGKLHFLGLDKVQETPFEFVLDGDAMDWKVPPFDDDVEFISWERVSKTADVPHFITLEDIVGHWTVTSYVVTDQSSGQSKDLLHNGARVDVTIHSDSTIEVLTSSKDGTVLSQDVYPFSIKDGSFLTVDKSDFKTTLDGDLMSWSANASSSFNYSLTMHRE